MFSSSSLSSLNDAHRSWVVVPHLICVRISEYKNLQLELVSMFAFQVLKLFNIHLQFGVEAIYDGTISYVYVSHNFRKETCDEWVEHACDEDDNMIGCREWVPQERF
eukprot:390361_1